MRYVYIIETEDAQRSYAGQTDDMKSRLSRHNAGQVPHTSKFGPWHIKTYLAFKYENKALAFERYLKTASGRAFAKKRL